MAQNTRFQAILGGADDRGRTGTGITSHGILSYVKFGGYVMKEVMLKKDIIVFLQEEIVRVRKKDISEPKDGKNLSYLQGHKDGQLATLYKVLNFIHGIHTRIPKK